MALTAFTLQTCWCWRAGGEGLFSFCPFYLGSVLKLNSTYCGRRDAFTVVSLLFLSGVESHCCKNLLVGDFWFVVAAALLLCVSFSVLKSFVTVFFLNSVLYSSSLIILCSKLSHLLPFSKMKCLCNVYVILTSKML